VVFEGGEGGIFSVTALRHPGTGWSAAIPGRDTIYPMHGQLSPPLHNLNKGILVITANAKILCFLFLSKTIQRFIVFAEFLYFIYLFI